MSELLEGLRQDFEDAEYRNAYADSFVNSYIAAQIKVMREDYPLTQGELGEKIGTSQPGIARFENVNYSSWKVESLRKLAHALNVWLKISFEEFGTLPDDVEGFNKQAIARLPFEKDPVFSPAGAPSELGSVEEPDLSRIQPHSDLGYLASGPASGGAAGAAG